MSIFESLRTIFKLLVANLSQEVLCYIGFCFLALMVAWSVLSLLFNSHKTFKKDCLKVVKFLRGNSISVENYREFIDLWQNFPAGMKRGWKRYETKRVGIPSDYLALNECFEIPLASGIRKQNRSIMKTAINSFVAILSIVSFATIGLNSAPSSTNAVLTTTILTDALIVPLVVWLLLIVNYYIYTTLRHYEYLTATEMFYDMVDLLDQKVELENIFSGDMTAIYLLSEVYRNETMYELQSKAVSDKSRNNTEIKDIKKGAPSLSQSKAGILGIRIPQNTENKNVIKTDTESKVLSEVQSGQSPEIEQNKFMILNERQFVSTVDRVEDLLAKAKKEKNKQMRIEMEKEVNRLMKALTEYKQKAKSKGRKE